MIDRSRLEAIVRAAGEMAMASWPGAGHAIAVWEKAPGNPVCEVDLAVDAFLKRELGALLPAAGWLSEETVDAPERLDGGPRRLGGFRRADQRRAPAAGHARRAGP